ncbi:MAG TPA: serine hydrolase [Rhodothermales bacterium]|nr:serine hydrolase [Rhodothermales bacterium]
MRIILTLVVALVFPHLAHAQLANINERALEELRVAAERAHSDAVLVLQDNEPIAEWYFGEEQRPIELMSVLKSIVSLGIGRLLFLGQVDSLDQPVYTFYPAWNQGQKKDITIRHLLNHTSGLQNVPNAGAEIYPSPDAIRLALAAELTEEPGTTFRYNNKATNLLAGIIEKVYGQRMDQFMVKELFGPMGIEMYKWYYDQMGNPHAMAGLELYARDLAKFGQLVLDEGVWQGERLVSEDYIAEMLAPGQSDYPRCGLLWWRFPKETKYTLNETRVEALGATAIAPEDFAAFKTLAGHTFGSRAERDAALAERFGPDWRASWAERFPDVNMASLFEREDGPIVAYYGDGYLGQTIMVIPEHQIVAVRQVRGDDDYNAETDGFSAFKDLVWQLFE